MLKLLNIASFFSAIQSLAKELSTSMFDLNIMTVYGVCQNGFEADQKSCSVSSLDSSHTQIFLHLLPPTCQLASHKLTKSADAINSSAIKVKDSFIQTQYPHFPRNAGGGNWRSHGMEEWESRYRFSWVCNEFSVKSGSSLRDRVRSSVIWQGIRVEPLVLHVETVEVEVVWTSD